MKNASPESSGSRISPNVVTITLVLSVFFMLRAAINPRIVDDTLISFQYARTLAEHGVLTWHPDLPMVDGYTSLGHILLIVLGMKLGLDIVLANTLVSVLSMAAIVVLLIRRLAREGAGTAAVFLGLLLVLANAGFAFWIAAGLESVLYAAVFFLVYLRFENALDRGRLNIADAAAMAAMGLVRPEGCFIALALVGFFVLHGVLGRRGLHASAPAVLVVVASIAAIFAWRAWQYGYPLPNTYYAKMSASRLLEIAEGAKYVKAWVIYFGGAAVLATFLHTWINPRNYIRTLFVLGQLAVVALSGGDPHPEMRFMLPLVPLIALDVAALASRAGTAAKSAAWVLSIIYLAGQFPPVGVTRWSLFDLKFHAIAAPRLGAGLAHVVTGEWPFTSFEKNEKLSRGMNRAAGERIGAAFVPGTRVAGADVGALAYFTQLPVLDALGLNHQGVAHLPKPEGVSNIYGIYHLDEVLKEAPEVIYLVFPRYDDWSWRSLDASGETCGPVVRKQHRLTKDDLPAIIGAYHCVSIWTEEDEGYLNLLVRRDAIPGAFTPAAGAPEVIDCYLEFQNVCKPQ
jgi:hypothetical protein